MVMLLSLFIILLMVVTMDRQDIIDHNLTDIRTMRTTIIMVTGMDMEMEIEMDMVIMAIVTKKKDRFLPVFFYPFFLILNQSGI